MEKNNFFRKKSLSGKKVVAALLLGACCSAAYADEDRVITGKVLDSSGVGLPGVTILQKNTSNGTVADMDGNFSLSVSDPASASLIVSFVGYDTQEIPVKDKGFIAVTLTEDVQALDEVVVTALGIKREKKSLGYAQQVVDGNEMNGHFQLR